MQRYQKISIQGNLVDYFCDEWSLHTMTLSRSSTQFISYDIDSCQKSGSFWIDKQLTPYPSHISNDLLYLPLATGELVAIDTFSGVEIVLFDLGASIPLGVCDSPEGLFVLCGVPINREKTICVCRCDKETGKRQVQSHTTNGNFLPLVFDKSIWSVVGQILYKYTVECELEASVKLNIMPRFKPVLTENYVAISSDVGTMEIFSRNNLTIAARILVQKNNSPPIKTGYDKISWMTGDTLHTIDATKGSIISSLNLKKKIVSTPLLVENRLYASNELGDLVRVDLNTQKVERLRLDNEPLWKPVHKDKWFFIASKSNIYQIGDE